jgi:parallel beta-helix repeat protein
MDTLSYFKVVIVAQLLTSALGYGYGDQWAPGSYFGPGSGVYIVGEHPQATHYSVKNTDIYGIIQPLLNELAVSDKHSTVVIAKGTYYLSSNIEIGSNCHLTGYGIDNSILKLVDFAAKFSHAGFIRSILTQNLTISNMTIDGNKHHQIIDDGDEDAVYANFQSYGRYGIFTEGSTNVTFDAVKVTNFQSYGFDPHGQKKTLTYGDGLVIKNCIASHNTRDGFTLDQSLKIHVFNCTSHDNGRHGFNVVTGSKYTIIENCTSNNDGYYFNESSSGCGITIQNNQNFGTHSAIFRNNTIVNPKKAGFCMNDVFNITVENNTVLSRTCMRVENTNSTSINNNTCINSSITRRVLVDASSYNVSVTNMKYITDNNVKFSGLAKAITVGYSDNATVRITGDNAYSVIQQSLDSLRYNGGGTLYIEEGVYLLESYVEVGGNTSVIGAGMNKTILRLVDNAAPWWIPNTGIKRSGFIRSTYVHNLRFVNFTIDGNRANQKQDKYSEYGRYGIYTEASNNVFIDGVAVKNFQGYGFDPHGVKATNTWSNVLTIVNSYSGFNGWDGYTIDQSRNVVLRNNIAEGNGRHGFNIVTGSVNITITNNSAIDNGFTYYLGTRGCGFMIQNNMNYGTKNVTATGNYVLNSSDAGFCATEVSNIVIRNNTINTTNVNTCIRIRNVTIGIVSENTCIEATRGVLSSLSSLVDVSNNIIVKKNRKLLM